MAKVKIAVGRRRETENTVGKRPGHVLMLQTGMIERGRERGEEGADLSSIAMIRHEPSFQAVQTKFAKWIFTLPRFL